MSTFKNLRLFLNGLNANPVPGVIVWVKRLNRLTRETENGEACSATLAKIDPTLPGLWAR
jgi:hypothetical protein